MSPNLKAFLDMIAVSEGTYGKGDDGYNVIVGGKLFNNGYVDHPRIYVAIPKLGIKSSAAGRYQLLARYYDAYKMQLSLPDFSPASQDAIAIQQIKERRALGNIESGQITSAIGKVKNIWASLPGAGYKQHEQKLDYLLEAYAQNGGVLVA